MMLNIKIKQMLKKHILLYVILVALSFGCKDEVNSPEEVARDYLEYGRVVEDGLIGYYPFDGDVKDYSIKENVAIVYGATPATGRFGQEEGSFFLDGVDDYIEIPNFYALDSDSGTICFWGRMPLPYEGKEYAALISKIDTAGAGYAVSVSDSYGFWSFYKEHKGSYGGRALNSSYRNADKFFFYAFTFKTERTSNQTITNINRYSEDTSDEVTTTAALKPEYADSTNWLLSFNTNNQPIFIGKCLLDDYNYFLGEIDDLLIYNRVLSRDEIISLYNWE